jgi:hypothetical protein
MRILSASVGQETTMTRIITEATQRLADQHAGGSKGKTMDGVIAVFSSEDPWVDDEDTWSWQLSDERLDLSPYYWGVNA